MDNKNIRYTFDKKLGTTKIKDKSGFYNWLKEDNGSWWDSKGMRNIANLLSDELQQKIAEGADEIIKNYLSNVFNFKVLWTPAGKDAFGNFEKSSVIDWEVERLKPLIEYSDDMDIPFDFVYTDETFTIVSFGGNNAQYILPTNWLEVKHYPDYSELNLTEIKRLHSINEQESSPLSNGLAPINNLSKKEIEENKNHVLSEVEKRKQELEDIERAKTPELAEMEAEIEAMRQRMLDKKAKMLADVNKKRFELEAKVEEMKMQIFYLETDINAILGYLGENVKFIQLKNGDNAPDENPIVLYQKLRFLDDELGKYLAFSDFDGDDTERFEEVLKYREDLVDMFIPSDKGIAMFKISKTGNGYATGEGAYKNVIESYKKIHGSQLSILIKNGGNLYITWLDERKISFTDDMFLKEKTEFKEGARETIEFKWEDTRTIEKQFDKVKQEQRKVGKEFSSRYILFSILQGVLDNTSFLTIPENVNVFQVVSSKKSPYIVLSIAEGWLGDTRFPNFSELLNKYADYGRNGDQTVPMSEFEEGMKPKKLFHQVGDTLFVLQGLSGWSPENNWSGRPYNADNRSNSFNADLAQNVRIRSGLHTLNLITVNDGYGTWRPRTYGNDEKVMVHEPDYFIRGKKSENRDWSEPKRGANFKLYSDEFINLTFLNSIFLENVIRTENIGSFGGNYASAVPALHTILNHLRNRESEELAKIKSVCPDFNKTEWQLDLSDWKLANNVHHLTEFQAKRFVKSIKKELE